MFPFGLKKEQHEALVAGYIKSFFFKDEYNTIDIINICFNFYYQPIAPGSYARLKGLNRVSKFNGNTVKIVAFIEKKGRWKVKLLHAKQEKKYLGVRQENLDPIMDWEPLRNDSEKKKEEGLQVDVRSAIIEKLPGSIQAIPTTKLSSQEQLQLRRNRNIRKLRKKLRMILMFEQKSKNGMKLSDEQQQQLMHKTEYQKQLRELQTAFATNKPAIQIDEIVKNDIVSIQKINEAAVDDVVLLDTGERGKVVFIGDVHFDDREMIGVLLDKWSPNAHNGSIDGKSYFVAPDGRGLLVPLSAIMDIQDNNALNDESEEKRGHANNGSIQSSFLFGFTKEQHEALVAGYIKLLFFKYEYDAIDIANICFNFYYQTLAVEDRVKLQDGKTGVVRYVGLLDFTDAEMVGIILDKWYPNANNGVIKGKQYFRAPPGRGYFAGKALIIEKLIPMPKINFKIGDRVRLARGKTGIVKYIGETEFAIGEVIGLQLDIWTPVGHNGTVRQKQYFKAQKGRGYFTRRSSISNVVIPLVKSLKKRRTSITYKLHPLNIGDRVSLTSDGKKGVIRYIGYPTFADGEVIGIELDEWSVNAHNGSVNGDQIFDVSPGRGMFVRREEVDQKSQTRRLYRNLI